MNLRDYARNQICVRCGRADEETRRTVVLCHYHGPFALTLGKGTQYKIPDHLGAHLCKQCHDFLDWRTDYDPLHRRLVKASRRDRSLDFAVCIMQTQNRLFDVGMLQVNDTWPDHA